MELSIREGKKLSVNAQSRALGRNRLKTWIRDYQLPLHFSELAPIPVDDLWDSA